MKQRGGDKNRKCRKEEDTDQKLHKECGREEQKGTKQVWKIEKIENIER